MPTRRHPAAVDPVSPRPLAPSRPGGALQAIADIAHLLAAAGAVDADVGHALSAVNAQLGASESALLLDAPARLWRAASAGSGAGGLTAERVRAALDGGAEPGLAIVRLAARGAPLGALAVRVGRPLGGEESTFLRAVADVLAPLLHDAAYTHRLETEVAERSREADAQRRFTARIIDSLPVGLYVIDREYRIQAWNRKRETGMQGVSREEAIGRTIFEILHRQPAELLRREFDDVFRSGQMQQFQMESQASGELRTYRITKIPMRVDDGAVSHVITIGEDITEWREAQERFAQAEKLAAIGTLAAGVMHEINNPLATIGACAESVGYRLVDGALGDAAFGAELGDALKVIEHEVRRCSAIVSGLLDFSRPAAATREPVDLDAVIDKTLFLLKHHSRFKRLTVHAQLSRALPSVLGSEEQLIQIFMALLLNAMDAMEGQGTISLRTRVSPTTGEVIAEVVDEGGGIRSSEMQKIFEPFYTTKAPGRGTGLGLSICYALVREHGGRIEVDSVVGKGSVFRIVLPTEEARA